MSITLKAMRVNRGFSQKEAAKHIGVSNVTLSNWETGKTLPSRRKMEKICEVYRCRADDIFLPDYFTGCDMR